MKTKELNITIIGAAQTAGCGRDGAQYGPKVLREAGLIEHLTRLGVSVKDAGDGYNNTSIMVNGDGRLKNIEQIAEFSDRLCSVVYNSFEAGEFPLVIGGDHSLGIGSVCGASKAFGVDDLCVVWVDAHTDINTQDTSPTGNVHGMSLASLLGYGTHSLAHICGTNPKIKAQNLVYVGSRDIDKGEQEIIQREGISVFNMQEIENYGAEKVALKLQEKLETIPANNIYLSIDIDVIDPEIAPGTGVPVPHGITLNQLQVLLDAIIRTGKVRGLELVEVNPLLDHDDMRTTLLAIEIVEHTIKGLLVR